VDPGAVGGAQFDDPAVAGRGGSGHVHGDRPPVRAVAVDRGRLGVGGVDHEQVAGTQGARQVGEAQVPQPIRFGDQQPDLVAGQAPGLRWLDGGQLGRHVHGDPGHGVLPAGAARSAAR
jgi:hypothetical protein